MIGACSGEATVKKGGIAIYQRAFIIGLRHGLVRAPPTYSGEDADEMHEVIPLALPVSAALLSCARRPVLSLVRSHCPVVLLYTFSFFSKFLCFAHPLQYLQPRLTLDLLVQALHPASTWIIPSTMRPYANGWTPSMPMPPI